MINWLDYERKYCLQAESGKNSRCFRRADSRAFELSDLQPEKGAFDRAGAAAARFVLGENPLDGESVERDFGCGKVR